ncbi:FecR family protein [Sphingobacterium sp. GVS05A]|uniref:FecR family protein n=1 Tax=Sphingobacterium TaxID=28453 RepID=UPI001CBEED98|nr:FecR family protein [Sphingobacterium sp. GVS05A]
MEHTTEHIIYLLSKSKLEGLSYEEQLKLDSWRLNAAANREVCAMLDNKEMLDRDLKGFSAYDWEASFETFEQEHLSAPKTIFPIRRIWSYGIAAVLIGMLTLFFVRYLTDAGYQANPDVKILPAQTTGTIYLKNGDSIAISPKDTVLSFATLPNNLTKGNDSLLISTPKGGKMAVLLPDGTKVWMNAETQLDYYETDSLRQVRLIGEAYFEVAKKYFSSGDLSNVKPFNVQTGNIHVTVLGTHFNVKANKSLSDFRATLYEGKVRVQQGERQIILTPGEEAYINTGRIERRVIDTEIGTALKDGYFIFNSEPLSVIMEDISAWYNVNVVYLDNEIKSEKFEGMLSRNSRLKDIINVLESTGKVNFKFKENTIYVDKKQSK